MIWRYKIPSRAGDMREAYGTPVDVVVGGKSLRAVYQFGLPGQVLAVVHLGSGYRLAHVKPEHMRGSPQETARVAVEWHLKGIPDDKVWAVINSKPVINTVPEVVGVYARM